MSDMMKKVKKMGGMANLQQMLGGGRGLPPGMFPR